MEGGLTMSTLVGLLVACILYVIPLRRGKEKDNEK